jgi:hypothetical protein
VPPGDLVSRPVSSTGDRRPDGRRALLATLFAAAVLLLALGWVVMAVAGRVTNLAAGATGLRPR